MESKRTVGVGKVQLSEVKHTKVHHDDHLYMFAPNRGGIWNFGDGEIAVAYLAVPMNYTDELPAGYNRHSGGPRSFRGEHPRWGSESGAMLSRSLDGGETWTDSDRQWIWNNDRTIDETLDWLRPRDPDEREQIDLSAPDSIIHFCHGEYLQWPLGGSSNQPNKEINFHLGKPKHNPSFGLRSRDRGRTWEPHATLIAAPSWAPDGGYLSVNLGHVRFDNGVLGIVGGIYRRNICAYYVSYNNGVTFEYVSNVARISSDITKLDGDMYAGYNYSGVHKLPDGRLMACMHQHWGPTPDFETPCVAFSSNDGMTWSEVEFVTTPGTFCGPVVGPRAESAPGNEAGFKDNSRQRCPVALVTSDGRIVILFARRTSDRGCRGIIGVISDDLGRTWSEEFVLRGDAYCWDLGYPVITELADGRLFTAYWWTEKTGEEPVPEPELVRFIAGTTFRID